VERKYNFDKAFCASRRQTSGTTMLLPEFPAIARNAASVTLNVPPGQNYRSTTESGVADERSGTFN
jgi:hypothetical protein